MARSNYEAPQWLFKWRGEKEETSTIVPIVILCDNLAYDDDTNDIIDITEAVRFDTNIPLSFPDRLHHIGVVAAIWVKRTKQLRFVL